MTTRDPVRPSDSKAERQARLGAQLRANLHRRKAQARAIVSDAEVLHQPAKTELPKT